MIDILLLSSSEPRAAAIAALLGESDIGHSLRTEAGAAKHLIRHAALIKKADLLIVEDATLGLADLVAIEEAINLKSTYNIRVINLSLGRPVYESFAIDPLCQRNSVLMHSPRSAI